MHISVKNSALWDICLFNTLWDWWAGCIAGLYAASCYIGPWCNESQVLLDLCIQLDALALGLSAGNIHLNS